MTLKHDKVKSLLKDIAANYIVREAGKNSLITATAVDISQNYRNSTIFVTVFPEEAEERALAFLKRKRGDFRDYAKKHSKLRLMPQFDFQIDKGEKARQRIDELSRK
jgi:ribosome-binding factor A